MKIELFFPEEFFLDEEREGFLVPSMMKRAWASELKILKVLEEAIFNKYGIRYYAEYGTLLGAIRHKGFIPWDDDMDIAMTRDDFNLLIEHEKELPYPYRILSVYNSDTYYTHNGLATNNREDTLKWDEERIKEFYGCPYIINFDINPLDYIPRDPEFAKLQRLLYYLSYSLTRLLVSLEAQDEKGEKRDEKTEEEYYKQLDLFKGYLKRFFNGGLRIDESRPIRNELCRIGDKIASLCKAEDADMLDYYPHMVYSNEGPFRKKEWYMEEPVSLPFETTDVKASKYYLEMVEAFYGENYMTPVRGGQVHEYPFYKKQEEYFKYIGKL